MLLVSAAVSLLMGQYDDAVSITVVSPHHVVIGSLTDRRRL